MLTVRVIGVDSCDSSLCRDHISNVCRSFACSFRLVMSCKLCFVDFSALLMQSGKIS